MSFEINVTCCSGSRSANGVLPGGRRSLLLALGGTIRVAVNWSYMVCIWIHCMLQIMKLVPFRVQSAVSMLHMHVARPHHLVWTGQLLQNFRITGQGCFASVSAVSTYITWRLSESPRMCPRTGGTKQVDKRTALCLRKFRCKDQPVGVSTIVSVPGMDRSCAHVLVYIFLSWSNSSKTR